MRFIFFALVLWYSGMAMPASVDVVIVTSASENRTYAGQSFAGITVSPRRPVKRAVELALYESATLFDTLGIDSSISELQLDTSGDIAQQLGSIKPNSLVILDLPIDNFEPIARAADQLKLVSVNVRHSDSYLRESLCLSQLFHTIPSDNMYFDALGQFLVYRGWRKVLVIKGPTQRDNERAVALVASLKKFGASIADERTFILSHHPDDRDRNRPDF
ncbi:MAG: hypothetical protein AAF404_11795, partial [Pseudomonadota bacterium]